ncbi:hypothetical protein AB3K78_01245 [Leucobacter sp. HNU]|uniref:hypothetical protein n=1 Tax=Leucobacter sp. HNU TaxID=3236805 RepID=UPI003A7FFD58
MEWNPDREGYELDERTRDDLAQLLRTYAGEVESESPSAGDEELSETLQDKAHQLRELATQYAESSFMPWTSPGLELVDETVAAAVGWNELPDTLTSLRDLLEDHPDPEIDFDSVLERRLEERNLEEGLWMMEQEGIAEAAAELQREQQTTEVVLPAEAARAIAVSGDHYADRFRWSYAPTITAAYREVHASAREAHRSAVDGVATLRLTPETVDVLTSFRGSADQAIRAIPTETYEQTLGIYGLSTQRLGGNGAAAFSFSVGAEHGDRADALRVQRAEWALAEHQKRIDPGAEFGDRAYAPEPPGAALVIEHQGNIEAVVRDPRFAEYAQLASTEFQPGGLPAVYGTVLADAGLPSERIAEILDSIQTQQATEAATERQGPLARIRQLFTRQAEHEAARVELDGSGADPAEPERTVLGQLDYLEFSGRVNELRQRGAIDHAAEQRLMDMAEQAASIEEFRQSFFREGDRLMLPEAQHYLGSVLTTPEGQTPASWEQSLARARAADSQEVTAPAVVDQEQAPALGLQQATAAEADRPWEPQGVFAELDARGFAGRMVELRSAQGLTEAQQESVMQLARDSGSLDGFAARLQYEGAKTLEPFAYKYLTSAVVDQEPASWAEAGEWVRAAGLDQQRPVAAPSVQANVPNVDQILDSAFPKPGAEAVTALSAATAAPERAPRDREAQTPTLTR